MEVFKLPPTAKVNRAVPKNAFERYATAKQKKLFTELVAKITWLYKLSSDTVNLDSKDIQEIQVFQVELKTKADLSALLEVIDRAIPYHIIFIVAHEGSIYLSTSTKHPHPLNADNAVIDWTFKTDWFPPGENPYRLNLKQSLDAVYRDFCLQLSPSPHLADKPLEALVAHRKTIERLRKEAARLKSALSNAKQFNQKVELNVQLKAVERELEGLGERC
jgi:hypothetical protein